MFSKQSDSTKQLDQALLLIRQATCGGVAKNARNPMFSSKYATLDAVYLAIEAACLKHGVLLEQSVDVDMSTVDATGYPTVVLQTLRTHAESGEYKLTESRALLLGRKPKRRRDDPPDDGPTPVGDIQVQGAINTYLKRQELVSLFALPVVDDDGNSARPDAPHPPRQRRPRSTRRATIPAQQGPPAMIIPPPPQARMTTEQMKKAAVDAGTTLEKCTRFLVGNNRAAPQDRTPERLAAFFRWLPANVDQVNSYTD